MEGQANNADDSEHAFETSTPGQWIIVSAWGSSHADHGTPGPHVRIRISDAEDAVMTADRIPELIDLLRRVSEWSLRGAATSHDDEREG